jgi:hypothetical protein
MDFKKRFEELKNANKRTESMPKKSISLSRDVEWLMLKTKKNKTLKDIVQLIKLELQN